ncbi:DUF1127 domain-containing protein [Sagittula sp. NFXS13]|uniref:DUF1127 domain-containing protein n=1 Tax=Sagittula sp. NFXS13 TaxID=2819095 RepID=UPI0032DFD537
MMSLHLSPALRATSPRAPRSLRARLAAWTETARQRHTLRQLDRDALRDIGISVQAAKNEADRPFWDCPDHWRM